MKTSALFIIFFIVVILFSINTKRVFSAPLNNIFTQGTYKVSLNHGDFEPGQYNFRFISKDSTCYVYIIDKDNIQRYSKRYDSKDLENEKDALFNSGTLLEGDIIIVYGDGEFYIEPIK
ncbi:hypothetical protein [Clostridium sp. D53t1_180928_C8]|uniref:hypothetical protein n=1 Tax=Clostridium sp. D53t1_180928_C8 TaxID=2787101 RepID=UPI0018AA74CD|nr:hypothetical protein [Clostridium sp. D53t1_180928_C8]